MSERSVLFFACMGKICAAMPRVLITCSIWCWMHVMAGSDRSLPAL